MKEQRSDVALNDLAPSDIEWEDVAAPAAPAKDLDDGSSRRRNPDQDVSYYLPDNADDLNLGSVIY